MRKLQPLLIYRRKVKYGMKTNHIEILAPAGSFESLRAAINARCDSVYFGVAEMNMRASAAKNFTTIHPTRKPAPRE